MHLQVDDIFMTEVTHRMVLQMDGILVTLHISLPRKNSTTNVTRKFTPFPFVNLTYVHTQVLLVTKVFIANTTHKLCSGRICLQQVLFRGE